MTPEPGKIIGGKYRLEKPLARGGMGSVWLARHTELDSPVAVKLMVHELVGTPVAEMRFKREAKAAAQLRSPHVVQIHDYGVEGGAPYMVMELLDGEDLSAELQRAGRLPVRRVATIVSQVAKALSMAHAAGIVHRDLKPSNLFLARSGEDEIVKVLDFGVAKETAPTLVVDKTTSGTLVGSPQYMSPEQARGEHIDLRSDLWSLGVLVFEALTGRPPFESTHLGALLAKIHEANLPVPSSIAPDLPVAIDAFLARALARRPDDRFTSAKGMADELAAIANGTATGAHTYAPARSIVVSPPATGRGAATGESSIDVDVRTDTRAAVSSGTPPEAGARATPEGEVGVAGRSVVGRAVDTLATNEPDPVSTTMNEREAPRKEGGERPPRALLAGVVAVVLIVALAIGWIGFGQNTPSGLDASGGGSGVVAAGVPGVSGAPGASGAAGSSTSAPSAARPATTETGVSVGPASAGSGAPQAGSTQVTASGPAAGGAGSAGGARVGATGTTRPASPHATAVAPAVSASATVAPVVTAAPTAAPVATPAVTATAHDPVFGLPSGPP